MPIEKIKQNKLPGKTSYSGRRRDATKKSGYKSHSDATGGRFVEEQTKRYALKSGETLEITFTLPQENPTQFFGFGVFYRVEGSHKIETNFAVKGASVFHENEFPSWSKYGSIWRSDTPPSPVKVIFRAEDDCLISLYDAKCGKVWHEYFDDARDSVLKNLAIFSPEGLFITVAGDTVIHVSPKRQVEDDSISLKECNRCARYLPVNFDNERATLSFSNHCIAKSPCKHKGFGLLVEKNSSESRQLTYGFQLECRFCKKFAVNGALNPMRTSDQMKEDGQRRRHFELLLSELNSMSPQMQYRHKTGRELTDEIWNKFSRQCFKCETPIGTAREMNLDHTRPLALLWQLDETATCLCKSCNSQKRDRFPVDFYDAIELERLAEVTGIPLQELQEPTPNTSALNSILENLDWLYETFLERKDLQTERDGKVTAELVCKALDRVISFTENKERFSFFEEYKRRKAKS
jgi:hypothetical protein